MPTVKNFSVARTQRSYDPAVPTPGSEVYSYSPGENGAARSGRNGAYDHPTAAGLVEGRVPTETRPWGVAQTNPVTAAAITTNANGPIEVRNTLVVATTTTITAQAAEGAAAGLIVSFTSTDADPTQLDALTVVDGGDNYTTGDTVEIDGYPGSVVTVTV